MMRIAIIMSVLFVALAGLAQGRTITVGPGSDYDFNSIQPAIDDSNDGDTIIVQPGLYRELVEFHGKNVTLTSTNPVNSSIVAATIIDYSVAFVGTEDANCMLMGFKINHGIRGHGTHATISHCLLSGNIVSRGTVIRGCDGTISNCVVVDNLPISDAIDYAIRGCHGLIKNCTVAHNFLGIRVLGGGTTTIENCIIYGNGVWLDSGATVNIMYSNVEGGIYSGGDRTVNWGPGNMDADPCFVRVKDWYGEFEGDYHLLLGSPCINAGDPNYEAEPNETDLDGKPRVIGGRIDMGAFEYSPPIPAEVRIVPRTINLTSKGKWITCYIWLGEDCDVVDIDFNSVVLEDEIQVQSLLVDEQEQIAIVRFSRSEVQDILNVGQVELTITGQLTDGTVFVGTDVIRVIDKGGRKSAK